MFGFGASNWERIITAINNPGLNTTLNSTQHLTIVDVLSEGEIEGFPSAVGYTKGTTTYNNAALKDVYLVHSLFYLELL